MDAKKIETLSISAVRDSIVRSDYLDQFITDNDKEPSWDGFVYIYNDKSKKKEKLIGRMAVQVKGTENDDFSNNEVICRVNTSDLTNYLYDGGIVFFVVYIDRSGLSKKIYYAELPPVKLRIIIDNEKGKKSKKIKLIEFPGDNNKKASIFLNCLNHCRKQASFTDAKLHTLEELEAQGILEGITSTISGYGLDPKDPQGAFLTNEVYMYAQIKGNSIPQPLEFIPTNIHTSVERNAVITVNNTPFYYNFTIIRSKYQRKVRIGQSFTITLFEGKANHKINYSNSSKLHVLVKDLEFLLAVLDAGQFEIEGQKFPIDISSAEFTNFDFNSQQEFLTFNKKMVKVFDMLGATDDFEIKNLTFQDKRLIDHLITAFINKEPVKGLKPDLSPIITIKIFDFQFVLAFIPVKGEKGTYNIYDFFRTKYEMRYKDEDGDEREISQYALLKAEDYIEFTNIRFDVLLPSYQEVKDDPRKYSRANFALLNLLTAFDKCEGSKPILLKIARDFSEWLMKADDDDLPYNFRCLNRLQVIRREREFTLDEIRELCSITENHSTSEEALVGAYLLLDNQMAAELHFENLEPENQERFKDYPIYHFWKLQ